MIVREVRPLRKSGIVCLILLVYLMSFSEAFACSRKAPSNLDMYVSLSLRPSEHMNFAPTEGISVKFHIWNFHENIWKIRNFA